MKRLVEDRLKQQQVDWHEVIPRLRDGNSRQQLAEANSSLLLTYHHHHNPIMKLKHISSKKNPIRHY